MKLALGQTTATNSREENLNNAFKKMDEAANKGANVICFPEVGFDKFFPQHRADDNFFDLAESIPGPMTEMFQKKAAELNMVTVFSLLEEGMRGEYYDSAICIDADGKLLGTTRMTHIYEAENYNEKFYYAPGNTLYPVYKTKHGNIGIAICQDAWFPEVMRALALREAEVIVVPTAESVPATGSEGEEMLNSWYFDTLTALMGKSPSFANGVFVGVANRAGVEEDMRFFGASYVTSPYGQIVGQAERDKDEVLVTDIDLNKINEARRQFALLRDRRPETYDILTKQWGSRIQYDQNRVNI